MLPEFASGCIVGCGARIDKIGGGAGMEDNPMISCS